MLRVVIPLLVVLALMLLSMHASAETPTPAPQTMTIRNNIIAIHNLHDGVPMIGASLNSSTFPISYVDGRLCEEGAGAAVSRLGLVRDFRWPPGQGTCGNAVGVPSRICVTVDHCTDEFVYEGREVSVELDWTPIFPDVDTVTVHFVHRGVPQEVRLTSVVASQDGEHCSLANNRPVTLSAIRWLNRGDGECTDLTARFGTVDFGILEASIHVPLTGSFDYYIDTELDKPKLTSPTAPAYSSKVTIHNVYNGVPFVGGGLGGHIISIAEVDGYGCGRPALQVITSVGLLIETGWPWHDYYPCNLVGLPTKICAGFGHCVKFVYEGRDESLNLDWASALPGLDLITGHFVHDGAPKAVTLTDWRIVDASGANCAWAPQSAPVVLISMAAPNYFGKEHCRDITAAFTTIEYGVLETSFHVPDGGNFDYYIETPALPAAPSSTAPPTAEASPTPTPALLPQAGDGGQTTHPSTLVVGLGVLASMLGAGLLVVALRSRRTRA